MNTTVPEQHPAVVLRSHYAHLKTMLAIALIVIVGLAASVVVLAVNDDEPTFSGVAPAAVDVSPAPGVRYDGGPEEGTRGPVGGQLAPSTRYDGGPEEGSRGIGR